MQNRTLPMFVSSDPLLGAFNVTPGGDRFTLQFKDTLELPPESHNISLEIVQGSVWWTVFNVKLGINDAFRLIVEGDATYDIVVEPGLYDPSSLNAAINNALINAGLASGRITISGDNATQKVLLTLNFTGLQVEWVPTSMFELLGFTTGQLVPAGGFTTGVYSEIAPLRANFSDISSFLLHTSLVQTGIPQGNLHSQMVAQIQIKGPPGTQLNFEPFRPVKLNVDHLRGQLINQADFWVTDQLNRTLDFNGEKFTMLLVIKYYIDEQKVTHI